MKSKVHIMNPPCHSCLSHNAIPRKMKIIVSLTELKYTTSSKEIQYFLRPKISAGFILHRESIDILKNDTLLMARLTKILLKLYNVSINSN